MEMKCENCRNNLKRRYQKRFCSLNCLFEQRRKMVMTECKVCRKNFKSGSWRMKRGYGKFCSQKCFGIDRKENFKHSEETKKKISEIQKGIRKSPATEFKKGMKPWNTGKRLTEKHRKKLSLTHGGDGTLKKKYIYKLNCERKKSIYEHRAVAEEQLGRSLSPSEDIHHIDGDKTNNDPKNLYLFPSRSEHTRYHQLFKSGKVGTLCSNIT